MTADGCDDGAKSGCPQWFPTKQTTPTSNQINGHFIPPLISSASSVQLH